RVDAVKVALRSRKQAKSVRKSPKSFAFRIPHLSENESGGSMSMQLSFSMNCLVLMFKQT
ncbi:hypothetical protein, partial [Acinetobacter sp. YH12136]|uniref:hypothetical protein n=1 Tax=Acinetobacter sp. YH12136 TaxID=2601120 RepID=UPI001C554BC7